MTRDFTQLARAYNRTIAFFWVVVMIVYVILVSSTEEEKDLSSKDVRIILNSCLIFSGVFFSIIVEVFSLLPMMSDITHSALLYSNMVVSNISFLGMGIIFTIPNIDMPHIPYHIQTFTWLLWMGHTIWTYACAEDLYAVRSTRPHRAQPFLSSRMRQLRRDRQNRHVNHYIPSLPSEPTYRLPPDSAYRLPSPPSPPPPPRRSTVHGLDSPSFVIVGEDSSTSKEGDECLICRTSKRCCVLAPCGHVCLCVACSTELVEGRQHLTECPMCRKPFLATQDIIRVFN